jgi:xanthine dehydrogenase accessory factor
MSLPSRDVVDALVACRDPAACLALVLETDGSTYVGVGGMAIFGAAPAQVGWLSGGCLEAEIAQRAAQAASTQRLGWLQIDTRDDEDLFSGSALGCRGRLRLALLPLRSLPTLPEVISAWWHGREALTVAIAPDGRIALQLGALRDERTLAVDVCEWHVAGTGGWSLRFDPPPRVAIFGAGPETPLLLPLLRSLGWHTHLVEARERWRAATVLADSSSSQSPEHALALPQVQGAHAVLVMHHHFERDREALAALAGSAIGFVGLLGPVRRREDLFRVLPAAARTALEPRLHSPVGLRLGGRGAEAIALSIAAELQSWRHAG